MHNWAQFWLRSCQLWKCVIMTKKLFEHISYSHRLLHLGTKLKFKVCEKTFYTLFFMKIMISSINFSFHCLKYNYAIANELSHSMARANLNKCENFDTNPPFHKIFKNCFLLCRYFFILTK